jgi:hypothetical protein
VQVRLTGGQTFTPDGFQVRVTAGPQKFNVHSGGPFDEACDPSITSGDGDDRSRIQQPILNWIGKVNARYAPHGPLDGLDIEKIALDPLGTDGAQVLRPVVDTVHEGTDANPTLEQYCRHLLTGLALLATGRSSYKNHLIRHSFSYFTIGISDDTTWYRMAVWLDRRGQTAGAAQVRKRLGVTARARFEPGGRLDPRPP